jgi:SulP family sulfate permease
VARQAARWLGSADAHEDEVSGNMTDSEGLPEIDIPGASEIREAIVNAPELPSPGRDRLRRDGIAGLNVALTSVPDGMASGVLAGVNPIYGLYACMAGPIAGSIFSSSTLMIVATTSAASLAAGQALIATPTEDRAGALFLMVLLIGAFQLAAGLLRLGRLTRFVSYSVMTGFIAGIGVLTILTQLPVATGYEPEGDTRVSQTVDLVLHAGDLDVNAVTIALGSLTLALVLGRSPVSSLSSLLAIGLPSVAVALLDIASIQTVEDVGDIPTGVPLPSLPSLGLLNLDIVTGAAAVAAVILVQGAGVSQSAPNPDGSRQSMSRDFMGEGAANVASAFFQGLPVGGSLSTTALSVLAGASSRWAGIFGGAFVGLIVVAFSGVVALVAMPALAALLILASARTIKVSRVMYVWDTGWPSSLAALTTFATTLFAPIQVAVGLGVAMSGILTLYKYGSDVSVVELILRSDGHIEEHEPAKELASSQVTVLDVYGHLFFAGARVLERLLPSPDKSQNPVVVLRLRGHITVGATLIVVLSDYADHLERVGGRLYLSGVNSDVRKHLVGNGRLGLHGPVQIYEATPIFEESTRRAYTDAETWLVEHRDSGDGEQHFDERQDRDRTDH